MNKVFNSFYSAIIFLLIVIVQPLDATFYALRPSDLWLLSCLFYQYVIAFRMHFKVIKISELRIIFILGFLFGIHALISTLLQAHWDRMNFDMVWFFDVYRFFRISLIVVFIYNLFNNIEFNDLVKFINWYFIIICLILLVSYFESKSIKVKEILVDFYTNNGKLDEIYGLNVLNSPVRQIGIMGNPNTTSILLASGIGMAFFGIFNKESRIIFKVLYLFSSIVIVIFISSNYASRTAILAIIITVIYFLSKVSLLKNVRNWIVLAMMIALMILVISNVGFLKIEFSERVSNIFTFDRNRITFGYLAELSGRSHLWSSRINEFNDSGGPFSFFFGLGYTQRYYDYSDNGFLSAFINLGLIGFFYKILFLIIVFKVIFFKSMTLKGNLLPFIGPDILLATIISIIIPIVFWEISADPFEHYKISQLYVFFVALALIVFSRIKQGSQTY